ncbi:Uncharacterised protein [Grimontia hollisae]|uniref:Uncharacterized protein n=1 Tax=Grimontia hollisae TaxID=673 RepID=A0A377HLG0_GRIHO|nr:Uncharacterised protein [Grimontia hollisae]STO57080.1 Uncharacterised protein [Grimontia hollisae]
MSRDGLIMRRQNCLGYWTNHSFTGEMLHIDLIEKAVTYLNQSALYGFLYGDEGVKYRIKATMLTRFGKYNDKKIGPEPDHRCFGVCVPQKFLAA